MVDSHSLIFKPLQIPEAILPKYVQGYNMPRDPEKLLPWDYVSNKMFSAEFYWITSISANGIPHSVPVWGIWFENRVFFDGSPKTKWVQNIQKNSKISVHLPSPREVCIIEGSAVILGDNDLSKEQWNILDTAHQKKYNKLYGSPYIYVNPSKIIAWDTSTYEHMTVWDF